MEKLSLHRLNGNLVIKVWHGDPLEDYAIVFFQGTPEEAHQARFATGEEFDQLPMDGNPYEQDEPNLPLMDKDGNDLFMVFESEIYGVVENARALANEATEPDVYFMNELYVLVEMKCQLAER